MTAYSQIFKNMENNNLISRSENYVFTEVKEEVVLMNIETGGYSSLNETGGQIWKLLEEPSPASSVLANLLEIYEGNEEQIKQELNGFIEEMLQKGFLEKQV